MFVGLSSMPSGQAVNVKPQPLCTEQPTILPYFEKMASTSDFLTTRVLRFPMNTREFMDRGSVLLVTLLAISFDDEVSHEAENVAEDQKNLTKGRRERRDRLSYCESTPRRRSYNSEAKFGCESWVHSRIAFFIL